MKCMKCNYISFDYNSECPKCGNSLAGEREEMRLPNYKPNPPHLLGALIGEEDGTAVASQAPAPAESHPGQEDLMANLDRMVAIEANSGQSGLEELEFDIKPDRGDEDKADVEFDIEPDDSDEDELEFDILSEGPEDVHDNTEPLKADDEDFEIAMSSPSSGDVTSADSVWDTEALQKKMSEMEKNEALKTDTQETPSKKDDAETDEFEIDLDDIEPLELEIDPKASDKKSS